jgi:hypothetical protein
LLTFFLVFSGCAASGPSFESITNIPVGEALIYIYRPAKFKLSAVAFDVKDGKKLITMLKNGGYFPYLVKAGELEIWAQTELESSVVLDAKAGQIYYIRGTLDFGAYSGRPILEMVPAEVGKKEIGKLNLLINK